MGVGIDVEHLNAWYGTTHTLQDINLKLPANHATALIGPSGCGKSTFVRCLNRMHETNPMARAEGIVRMGDVDIYKDAQPVEIRRRIGMVFQRPNPFPTMSIYDNVASGLKLNGFRNKAVLDETVERSLKAAALWEEVKDDLKKKSGASLSGGQQQRMCIARALAVDPEVLLMDEPASALDLLAMEQPMAIDLRFILSVIRINADLERVGDQAVNIAVRVREMGAFANIDLPVDIPKLASLSLAMVRKALQAFIEADAEMAQSVLLLDDQVDEMNDAAFYALSSLIKEKPELTPQSLNALIISRNLERVGDHATNIAEDVIFWVRGADVRHNTTNA